jgi:uncharacterized membrane protein YcaP (DUF421 family)
MFQLTAGETVFTILLRSALIYMAVLVGLRLSGKREIGQMTVLDLAVLLLLANAVQNAMVGSDTSIFGGLLAGGMLLFMNWALAFLRMRSPRLRRALVGTPSVLVLHGEMMPGTMKREGVDEDMLNAALREHGFPDVSGVEMVVLETDGSMSVIPVHAQNKRIRRVHRSRENT